MTKKKFHICLDIDGVLSDTAAYMIDMAKRKGVEISDDKYNLDDRELQRWMFSKHPIDESTAWVEMVNVLEDAVEFTSKVSSIAEITICTGRHMDVAKETLYWLRDNGISFDRLVFPGCDDEKIKYIQQNQEKYDIIIEDCPMILEQLMKSGAKVCKRRWNYNKDIKCEAECDKLTDLLTA